ncbi:AMP-binding protein [Halioxenophilus sp. WMMB6]|uniref:AMP-binding protein n=1 Tax=Halioxenophilus sp. WMMB6 TaxID=3073815 RepID=UPI00295F4DFD|nr:AMP-binding protein [Halioxenophilus sp. WMMB6]
MSEPTTLCELFDLACSEFGQMPAFTCMGQTLSYDDIHHLSLEFASYLQHHTSLKPGDRIAVQMPNLLQYPVVVFGALKAGLVVVNTNPLYTEREIEHQLNDAGAKAIVLLANIGAAADHILANTSIELAIVTEVADLHPPLKSQLINFAAKYLKRLVPKLHFPKQITLKQALKLGAKQALHPVAVKPEHIAVLQYTGGTTGVAKGAMLSHRNLASNRAQIVEHLADVMIWGEEVYVAPLPLYHIYAFNFHCLSLFSRGARNILIPNPRDIPAFVKALKHESITGFVGLDTLFKSLCHNDAFCQLDFSRLRTTSSGGMALTRDTAELWHKVTGCMANEGYGLTETSPVVSANLARDIRPGTVGLPLPHTEIKTIDDQGSPTAVGEPGELCVRGPQVMEGYWQRPDETAKVLQPDGWFHTGDIATIDAEGYIRIVDRKKDMIVVSGFNVYPNEVEEVVVSHPKVREAAVIGVPDEKSGEAVKVYVVAKDSSLTKKELIAYCREQLTAYKIPRIVEFCTELPKSNVGKVLRKELRDAHARDQSSANTAS